MVRLMTRERHLFLLGIICIVIFTVLALLHPETFLTLGNLQSMGFQLPEFALLALAVAVPMLTGGIDLSVVSTALLSATAAGLLLASPGPLPAGAPGTACAVVLALIVGGACGLGNGFLITRLSISPILATLGTMQLYSGLTVVLTGGSTLYGFPETFVFLGNGTPLGIPMPLLILLVGMAVTGFLLRYTTFGFKLYLLGGNPRAARLAGLENRKLLLKTYILAGSLSATAGLIMSARTNSINADYGSSYLLLAILVAVLAGVKVEGGAGKMTGLLLAVFSLQLLSTGLNLFRFQSFAREWVWGGLLILVMAAGRLLPESGGRSEDAQKHKRRFQ